MKVYVNGAYMELTAEEIAEGKTEQRKRELQERTRPLTIAEVNAMLISAQVNTLDVDDNTALRMKEFYPEWKAGMSCAIDFKLKRNGKLWKCLQAHTSQEGWEPETAASLWTEVNEIHSGTEDDPIPYSGNMVLENGKYYMQDWNTYLCNRDTVNPVHNPLSELIGLYVEAV